MTHPTSTQAVNPSTRAAGRFGRARRMEIALAAARAEAATLRSEVESWRAGGLFRRACRAEVERDLALAATDRLRRLCADRVSRSSYLTVGEVLDALAVTE